MPAAAGGRIASLAGQPDRYAGLSSM